MSDVAKSLELPKTISVRQLSEMMNITVIDVIKTLMKQGVMANINQVIEYDVASKVAEAYGYKTTHESIAEKKDTVIAEIKKKQESADSADLKPRPPVVTIMGHVDHGKTSILDAIRSSRVTEKEAGGITQHIGAYQVEVNNQKITFLDTPGHEAFTAMRARGAQVTDVTVLVVAADDGVMPQTIESIAHAKAANVPIVVAINKIDKAGANPDNVKKQLADNGLIVEEWGGESVSCLVSGKTKQGIPELLEDILLVAEMENLRCNPNQPAKGVVIEATMDKSKGAMATILVHDGTLKLGDIVVAGTVYGKVKAMYSDSGKQVRKALPATPVAILGFSGLPDVGDTVSVVQTEKQARDMVSEFEAAHSKESSYTVSLATLYDQISSGKVKELPIVLKTDVQGSLEPIKNSLEKLSSDDVKISIVHAATGNVTESDINLAAASKGLVLAFNIGTEANASKIANSSGVDVKTYSVIYDMIDDVEKALKGLREPEMVETIDGYAVVKAVFPGNKNQVAGCQVMNGKIRRNLQVRVKRGETVLTTSSVQSLRRFKDSVNEVTTGLECGIGVEGFSAFQPGDVIEAFHLEKSN
jgi:translation initiation factor IF-2